MQERAVSDAHVAAHHPVHARVSTMRSKRVPSRLGGALHEVRADHRRDRERHHGRDHDGERQRDREFAQQPADDAVHEQQRDEGGDQRHADRDDGEADLPRARRAPPASAASPASRLRNMFSIMTMASSTTKPTETASAISDRLSTEKPGDHMAAQVPASDSGTVTPAASVGVGAPQEDEHHQHHQHDRQAERDLHVVHAGADGAGAVGQHGMSMPAGIQRLISGISVADAIDRLDDVGVGLLGDDQQDRRLGVEHGRRARSCALPCSTVATSRQAHDVAVRHLDDDVAVVLERAQLVVASRW